MLFNNLLSRIKTGKKAGVGGYKTQKKDNELVSTPGQLSADNSADAAKQKDAKGSQIDSKTIKKVVGTEKASQLMTQNRYVFLVYKTANKTEIKKEINRLYGVMPIAVNVLNVSGKTVRSGKTIGRTANQKKVYITLKKGDSIKI